MGQTHNVSSVCPVSAQRARGDERICAARAPSIQSSRGKPVTPMTWMTCRINPVTRRAESAEIRASARARARASEVKGKERMKEGMEGRSCGSEQQAVERTASHAAP